MPPQPTKATPITTNITERGRIMKILANEENKEKERKIKVQVHRRATIAELKEDLIPLIGVPPTGFRVFISHFIIRYNLQYEIKLNDRLMDIKSGKELIVRLGRALRKGELRVTLYILQVSNTKFCSFMMESIVAMGTPIRELKKQIIEEAKAQGINSALELDKIRLHYKNGMSLGIIYLDHQLIDTSREIYVEPLKEPEYDTQVQVYVIRWRPSQCSFDLIEVILLDKYYDPEHVIEKLSELSGIPVEYIYYTKSESFPVEISCLDIEHELKWNSVASNRSFLSYDDGRVIYYRDNRETMKELTDKERSDIQEAEEARFERIKEYKSHFDHIILN